MMVYLKMHRPDVGVGENGQLLELPHVPVLVY
jgi:hypothetical protein